MKSNNIKIVKKANKFLVLEVIREYECITVEGIINRTGLSRPTVLNIIKELLQDNIIIKSGYASSDIGRQPVLYSINANGFFAMGIDFDGPPVRLAISNLNGEPIYTSYWEIDLEDSIENIFNTIIENINKAIIETGIEISKILGLGLGLPAVIDKSKNKPVIISRISQWRDIALDVFIKSKTGLDVYVKNDAHLLGLAEKNFIKNTEDIIYIIHRSGIGASIIMNGKLYDGNNGNSGYIGHTVINFNGKRCDCGEKGCLETYCSKRAIVEEYYDCTGQKKSYYEIIKAAEKRDQNAIDILASAGEVLGLGISNIIKSYDIYTVVIGDLKCSENHLFFKIIKEAVKRSTKSFALKPPKVILGKLKEENFGLGGCHYVLGNFFSSPRLTLKV